MILHIQPIPKFQPFELPQMSSLRELAAKISRLADQLEDHRTTVDSEPTAPRQWLQDLPKTLELDRLELVDILQEMKREVQTVESTLSEYTYTVSECLHHHSHCTQIDLKRLKYADLASLLVIHQFKVAQNVPKSGSITYRHLAQLCGTEESTLHRVLRYAMTNVMFHEPEPGHVAHTELSLHLTQPDTIDGLGMLLGEMMPAFLKLPAAFEKFPRPDEPQDTAYSIANGTELPFYRFLEEHHPDRGRRFGAAMRYYARRQDLDHRYLYELFPWREYDGEATVAVDIGGGQGTASVHFARYTKEMRFVVQDLPKTVAAGEALLPAELKPRIDFVAHDFFTEQPVRGADIYILKWIMHNWSDKYCLRILRALVPALKTGAKVLLFEYVLHDEPDSKWSTKWLV